MICHDHIELSNSMNLQNILRKNGETIVLALAQERWASLTFLYGFFFDLINFALKKWKKKQLFGTLSINKAATECERLSEHAENIDDFSSWSDLNETLTKIEQNENRFKETKSELQRQREELERKIKEIKLQEGEIMGHTKFATFSCSNRKIGTNK